MMKQMLVKFGFTTETVEKNREIGIIEMSI